MKTNGNLFFSVKVGWGRCWGGRGGTKVEWPNKMEAMDDLPLR